MEEISLLDYLELLLRRKWTIVAVTLIVVLVTGVMLAVMPRVYEGQTILLFPQQRDGGIGSQLGQIAGLSLLGGASGLQSSGMYVIVLQSRTVNENVYKRLGLDRYGVEIKDLKKCVGVSLPKEGGMVIKCQAPTSWLRGHVPGKELGRQTAQLTADIANSYVSELQIYDRSSSFSMGKKNRLFIESQLMRTKEELTLAEDRLEKFQEAHPTLAPPDKSSAYTDQARDLASKRIETEVAIRDAEGQLSKARATWKAGAPENISAEAVIDSPAISGLQADLAKLEVERATILENFTETHPRVVSLDQEIQKTYDRIHAEVNRVMSGKAGSADPAHQELLRQLVLLEISRDGMEARKSALNGAMSDLEHYLSGLPAEEVAYARLLREVNAAETVYTTLLAEHAKAQVQEGKDIGNFTVLDEAVAQEEPAKPRVKITLLAALLFGCMLGIFIASAGLSAGKSPNARR